MRKNINSQNKKSIIKIGNLLQVETWQRLPLLDDYNFFSDVKLQENAPFFVRNLMNAFNSVSMVNSKSIKDNFYKLLEQYSYGKFNNSSTVSLNYVINQIFRLMNVRWKYFLSLLIINRLLLVHLLKTLWTH